MDSTADERVVNNVMRHEYRVLTDEEKRVMKGVKDAGLAFVTMLHAIGGTDPKGDKLGSRELALAATNAEQAVMWAVKHLTR
jgi:RNA 3'-terminal phosphate cyclase